MLPRYVVDSTDLDCVPVAREELMQLLSKPSLEGIPLLVLGSKADVPERIQDSLLVKDLDLENITNRKWQFYEISSKERTNLDLILEWIVEHV
jgi:ADP-ribosylation factor-like protein 8